MMKTSRISVSAVALLLAAFLFPAFAQALADDAANAAATALLTFAPWKLSSKAGVNIRVFKDDGTFTTIGKDEDGGRWVITNNFVVLMFADGHKEALDLPLNPKGTQGLAADNSPLTAVMVNSAVASSTPVPTPAPAAPAPTPTPAIASAPSPAQRPVPAPVAPPAAVKQDKAAVQTLLLSRPWKFLGSWWFAIRVFAKDGTFSTVNGGEQGTWAITDTSVALTFPDGHIDSILLPLSLQGSAGADKEGHPVTILPGKPPENSPTVHSVSALDYLRATPTPGPQEIARRNAASAAILVAGPWKLTGRSWTAIRIFARDGTFTTIGQAKEYGTWKIEGDKVNLIYPDGHIDTISLPLDPKGTDAADRFGGPVYAIRQDTSTLPTPAPTAPRETVAGAPVNAATPARASTPAQAPTPPRAYFGTEVPPSTQ